MCLVIYVSSLEKKEKSLFRCSATFLIGFFVFLVLSFMNCLHILETDPFVSSNIILSHFERYPFTLFVASFIGQGTSQVAQMIKHLPTMWETRVQALGQEDPLEKEMAMQSSILAW